MPADRPARPDRPAAADQLPDAWTLRRAEAADARAVADVWLASRHANVPAIPPPVHTDQEVRRWVRDELLPGREVWICAAADGPLLGMLALDAEWLDQLYVLPGHTGRGIGSALLDLAKTLRPAGFGLWTFAGNLSAQRFYRRHGLVEMERTDGSENEEGAPDIRFVYRPVSG